MLRATALPIAMLAASPAGAVRGIIAAMIDDYSRRSGLKFNLIVGPDRPVARRHHVRQAHGPRHRLGAADG
jgi:hypothetical protein